MTHGIFRSTTALAVMASLATPLPVFAQQGYLTNMTPADIVQEIVRCRMEEAGRGAPEAPNPAFCTAYETGALQEQLGAEFEAYEESARQLSAAQLGEEVDAQLYSEAEAAASGADQAQAEPQPEPEQPAAEGAQAGAPAADQPAEAAQSDEAMAAAEDPTSPESIAESAAADQPAEAQSDEEMAAAEDPTSPEAIAESAAAEQPADQAADQAQTDQPAETASEEARQLADQLAGDAGDAADTPEAAPDTVADAETPDADPATPDAEQSADQAAQPDAEQPVEEQAAQADPEPMDSQQQADALEENLAQAAGALAAAAGDEADAEAEVTEETVTEETARSSDEEFDTSVSGDSEAQAEADGDDDDNGLSNFERAALLGLGAVAIGNLLNEGERVVSNSGDRAVVEDNGQYRIIKNDDALLRRPGSDVKTYRYSDGSTRSVVTRDNGATVETVRAADGRVLRRTRTLPDGTEVVLFDDTQQSAQVEVNELPQTTDRRTIDIRNVQAEELARALAEQETEGVDRSFSLAQIRNIDAVRGLVPEITVNSINFETNSAVIRPEEAEELAALGNAMRDIIERNPREVFLVEGHTDATGAANYNLALSDRRAETVALALTEYFDVPPENLIVQGYGETDLVVPTAGAERANRRAAVRRITPLLASND